MKSVLISIQPKWCRLIASGKKTVEVRKTRPKIATPFKCYIYCTKSKKTYESFAVSGKPYECGGRVIGEFVCDRIQKYECEFVNNDCYEEIASVSVDEDGDEMGFIEWSNDSGVPYENIDLYEESCIQYNELKKYMAMGFGEFYGWHISNLIIYDKPKELSEFSVLDDKAIKECKNRERIYVNPDSVNGVWLKGSYICTKGEEDWCSKCKTKPLKRPPQSWCYVECQ